MYAYVLQELEEVPFRTPVYKTILAHFQEQLAVGRVVDVAHFVQHDDEGLKKVAIDLTASPYAISDHWEGKHQIYTAREEDDLYQTAFKHILRLKLRLIQQLIEEHRTGLQQGLAPEAEEEVLQVHTALKKSEAAIAQQLGVVVW